MGLFSRGPAIGNVATEHTIVIRVTPPPGPAGTATDMASVAMLEEKLIAAINQARAGEFDGNEFAAPEVYFYAYGPDGNRLLAAVEPVLRAFPAPCRVLVRYGQYQDESAPSNVVEF